MTVRLLADENFKGAIVVGLQRQVAGVDVARVQDVGLRSAEDPALLQWAAAHERILITHDSRTIPDFAFERVSAGLPMPGVFVVRATLAVATAIAELAMIAGASVADEWVDRVVYLPLR